MNPWTDYYGYLRTGDCSIELRDDTPSSASKSSAAAAVTSSCISDVTDRSAGAHIRTLVHGGGDVNRKPMLGLKKCFHCPHCRYSTDRKNNLKRHLGTMHRDHYGAGVTELDQSIYHVSAQRRSVCQSCVEDCDFNRMSFHKRHVASVLLDDFVRTDDVSTIRADDVNTRHGEGGTLLSLPITKSDDVSANDSNAGTEPLPPSSCAARNADVTVHETTQTNDVNIRLTDVGAQPPPSSSTTHRPNDDVNIDKSKLVTQPLLSSSVTTRNDDVKIHQTAQNGDVSSLRGECGSQPVATSLMTDHRNSLPQFEPRPAAAYRRHSSRMFFYDRLRCTHCYTDTDD